MSSRSRGAFSCFPRDTVRTDSLSLFARLLDIDTLRKRGKVKPKKGAF
jgi:hypothetical protein